MPTQPRDTWRDWFDDADQVEQVTRDELLAEFFTDNDRAVTTPTIRYWEGIGVLPKPTRRWHNGATRTLYPRAYAFAAIVTIQRLQEKGYSLQEIADYLPRRVNTWGKPFLESSKWGESVRAMATEFQDHAGVTIRDATIVLTDDEGETYSFSYPVKVQE